MVGCGGLGVPAAWTLALAGARNLRLIDADRVELSNLHRQILYGTADIGQRKVEALAAKLRARFAGMNVVGVATRLDQSAASGLLDGCAAVFEGSDDAQAKFAVNDWVLADRRRTATIAAAIGRRGQWMTFGPASACYRCLFPMPPPPEALATCQVAGVIGPTVGLVGALAGRSLAQVLAANGEPVADPALGALVRWNDRGLLRTAVCRDPDCVCGAPAYSVQPGAPAPN